MTYGESGERMPVNEQMEMTKRLQRALANSNPAEGKFREGIGIVFTCIHCGNKIKWVNYPPVKQGHRLDCIWLVAVKVTSPDIDIRRENAQEQ